MSGRLGDVANVDYNVFMACVEAASFPPADIGNSQRFLLMSAQSKACGSGLRPRESASETPPTGINCSAAVDNCLCVYLMTFAVRSVLALACCILLPDLALGDPRPWVEYPGKLGAGQGKHVVFLSGDEEYRSEEGLPMLAKILSQRHGFKCTVLFAVDPKTGEIDPNNRSSLPGSEALDTADAVVMLVRFRTWPAEAMARFVKCYEAGKPIIALRTSTHPFAYPDDSAYRAFNNFGEDVLGEGWVSHWGRHKVEATRGVVAAGAERHPILRGVSDLFGDTDVYEAHPPGDAEILVRGQVLSGMTPDSPPATYRKKRSTDGAEQGVNSPMMPIAWIRQHKNQAGTTNRIFCTTMGAATDLQSDGLRRLVINAVYWGLEMEVPRNADVELVGQYEPSAYGFDGFRRGMRPADFALESAAPGGARENDSSGRSSRSAPSKLPPSALPLRLLPHERIALAGNSLAERMNLFGHFEVLLHTRFPRHELVVRNFARPCDSVDVRQRPTSYTAIDDPLRVFGPDTILCFFGFNEAFAGAAGEAEFRAGYAKYLDEMAERYPRAAASDAPRFVLVSPIAWEPTGKRRWPDAADRNQSLRRYAAIVSDVARERGLAFIDLFSPTEQLFGAAPGMQHTINGCHLNEAGDREVAVLLDRALFGDTTPANIDSETFQALRAAVNEKSWLHLQDYRMLNGWYVYGGRRTWDTETFPREFSKIRAMAAVRDRYVWDLALGKQPAPPDDSATGELHVPPTRFGNPRQDYSEPEELRYLSPEECIATMSVPDGFQVRLFASEREFPELAKPCQLNFDNRGRLWASCMPTYPQWKPGDAPPSDRLLIFEDTDSDGRADVCKVFYDKLHCSTGFEFWNGGVVVVDQPRLLWLKDTDGDDRADVVVHLFDGWASDDTHHRGAFEYSNGGLLHILEGISMSTTVETPWGPHRTHGPSGAHVIDLRTMKIRHFETPGYGNPWCYVFDSWGQGIVGDGTGARQHWDTPLSGAPVADRRGMDPIFDNQGMRPAVGSEFLISRHLPDDVQGQFIYACVINMNGMPRFSIYDQSAGYRGHRLMRRAGAEDAGVEVPDDLLASTDKNFRPVDPQIGPDGALWFGDWCNALIGHMQYSQRDPNRDHQRGRIYRLVHTERPLVEPATQQGKSESELLDQLRAYEPRTRYRARRELRDRPTDEVAAAAMKWVAALDPDDADYDRLRCEALWVLQGHHAVDIELLKHVLRSSNPRARAAAMHVVADEREYLADAQTILGNGVRDADPRVRLEAIRGLSFFPTSEAVQAALAALEQPLDSWLEYTLAHTLGALEPVWSEQYQAGTLAAAGTPAHKFITRYIERQRPGLAAQGHLTTLLNPESPPANRRRGYDALERLHGERRNGEAVFQRVCAACHRVKNRGYEFGPDLSDVGRRLSRREMIESILEPTKKVDAKYTTTTLITAEGTTEVGFVVAQTDDSLTLLMAEGKRKTFAVDDIDERFETTQSSMPENLASVLAPAEFLDVVEYMATLK
jgi:putative membrane-bound dehydrogenase-like protein